MTNDTPLIISGSARPQSDTRAFIDYVFDGVPHHLIDLLDYRIAPYSYTKQDPEGDQFMQVAQQLLQHNIIVFATPVYWYSMSGYMKTLFDRFTDITRIHKELGRQLKDKHLFLLSVGSNEKFPEGFEVPFINTADYFDMHYKGSVYLSTDEPITGEQKNELRKNFVAKIKETQKIVTA